MGRGLRYPDGVVLPLEERIRDRQRRARALADERLARLPEAVALLRSLGAEQVWLFGSLAGGEPHARSDVDLLVRGLPADSRTAAWWELEEHFAAPVDLLREEESGPALRAAVHARGRDVTALGG